MTEIQKELSSEKASRSKALVVVIVLGLLLLGLLFYTLQRPENYLGVWKLENIKIEIMAKPGKEVKPVHTLKDGKEARLLLPVRVKGLKHADLSIILEEGIYRVEGQDVLIAFCKICGLYLVFPIRRGWGTMSIGFPIYGRGKDKDLGQAVWHLHKGGKFTLDQKFNWVTYEQVPEK